MILQHLSSVWSATGPAVANHLWQSTVYGALAGLLTLLLRKDHANARYWLLLVSSLKFLFPFALLVSLGSVFVVPRFHAGRQAAAFVAIEQVSQPFVRPAAMVTQAVPPSVAASDFSRLLPALLVATWLGGFLIVLLMWCIRWRRMSKVLRSATPFIDGKEVEVLRRLERLAGVQKHIPIFLSRASVEPGIFGVRHPVLILPKGICDRLNEKHLQAVLAHEVWHVRRRDNLAAAVHMLVQALFWFHPLVWWLGSRLVEERERACDEQVLRLGNPPKVYAESILKTCEFCVESPLACASGVAGGDLKNRIVRIMTERIAPRLDFRKKLLLGAAGFLAVAAPVGLGLTRPRQGQVNVALSPAEPALARTAEFEVASIKRFKPSGPKIGFRVTDSPNDGRFYAAGPTVRMLIRLAYGVQDSQIVGGPDWIKSERFNIQAKADSATDAELKKLNPQQAKLVKEHMLQELLADRFELKLHRETKDLPIYSLVVAKNGPKLKEAEDKSGGSVGREASGAREGKDAHLAGPGGFPGDVAVAPGGRIPSRPRGGVMMRLGPGGEQRIVFQGGPLSFFTTLLGQITGRMVIDKTGLAGRYNFELHWVSNMGRTMMGGENIGPAMGTAPTPAPSGPSIFTALQEQLGLKLKSEKGPVTVLVIDQIEQPTPN
jgi:bla regulator protein blaR1